MKVGDYVCWKGECYTLLALDGDWERGMAWLASADHFSHYTVPVKELSPFGYMGCK